MFIPRQTYIGRVIAPAKFYPASGNRKPFITFVLSVNNLVSVKGERGYEKTSGKFTCSYGVSSDTDMVATVLSRISTSETSQTLGGKSYKSVEVLVEGTERLVQVLNEDGSPGRGYYKNLDFCLVTILDPSLRQLYKLESNETEDREADDDENQPKVAPAKKASRVVSKQVAKEVQVEQEVEDPVEDPVEEVENDFGYEIGEVVQNPKGEEFKYVGGDPELDSSWEKVEVKKPIKKVPPFMKANKTNSVVEEALSDEEESLDHSKLFAQVAKGKGLAV